MLTCRFGGHLINAEVFSHNLGKCDFSLTLTFILHSFSIISCEKGKDAICLLHREEEYLPFYCSRIEKHIERNLILPSAPILYQYLVLSLRPFTTECFSARMEGLMNHLHIHRDWTGIVFPVVKEDKEEEELFNIGVALLSLNENE